MKFGTRTFSPLAAGLVVVAAIVLGAGAPEATAQDSHNSFELHANGSSTAADVGLPVYPGSRLAKSADNDGAVDMGFTFGDTHFRLIAAHYVSNDSTAQIFDFYRGALARYGDVLECDHGKPVGSTKVAHSGLTCGDVSDHDDSSQDHELRAGTPRKFRIVGLGERDGGGNHFGLVYVEVPKGSGASR